MKRLASLESRVFVQRLTSPESVTSLYAKTHEKKYFDDNEVTLNFLETDEIRYDQYGDKFVPFLSILDVIMFNRKESIKLFLNNYRLE